MRTDINKNPIACTTDLAKQGLAQGIDYMQGTLFVDGGHNYYTAHFILDPIDTSIKLIDKVGFYTAGGAQRWIYIAVPQFIWQTLTYKLKVRVVQYMYAREGGTEMNDLFKERLGG